MHGSLLVERPRALCKWRYKTGIVCYRNCHSPKMAVGDQSACCTYHQTDKVALFCQTCEELICTKCISKGPNSSARHHDHVYLDLSEAYDIQREEFEKVVVRFKEQLDSRKNERKELQTTVQKLKFELLRRKTDVEKRVKSLKDAVRKNETVFLKRLSKVIGPAIERIEQRFNDVEYDVVSREGLIGTSESVQALSPRRFIPFLRLVVPLKRDMKSICSKEEKTVEDALVELGELSKVSLSLSRAKTHIARAFTTAIADPSPPKVLPRWCTVGTTSAHITWKFARGDLTTQFCIYYKSLSITHRNKPYHGPEKMCLSSVYSDLGYKCLKVRKFTQKRTSAILHKLTPGKTYEVKITAVNSCGESAPTTWYFVTCQKSPSKGVMQKHDPRKCNFCGSVFKLITWSIVFWAVILYGMLSIYLIYTHSEVLIKSGCDFVRENYKQNEWIAEADFMEYFHIVCPKKVDVPQLEIFETEEAVEGIAGIGGRILDWFSSEK